MSRTSQGWLGARIALATLALATTGAIAVSPIVWSPAAAYAEEPSAEIVGAATVQAIVNGNYYLAGATGAAYQLDAIRTELTLPHLEETKALDSQAQARVAWYALTETKEAPEGARESVAFLPADQVTNPLEDFKTMCAAWNREGSALLDPTLGYCGVAAFQTQTGDLYLVAVFSDQAGDLGEARVIEPVEGTGLSEDGTVEVPVAASTNVDVDPATLAIAMFASPTDGSAAQTAYAPQTALNLGYQALIGEKAIQLANVQFVSANPEIVAVEGATATALAEGTALLSMNIGDNQYASVEIGVLAAQAPAEEMQPSPGQPAADQAGQAGTGDPAPQPEGAPQADAADPAPQPEGAPQADAADPAPQPQTGDPAPQTDAADPTFNPVADPQVQAQAIFHAVSFDANGGEGTMEALSVEDGTQMSVPAPTFVAPAGYAFASWNTALDGSGTSYAAGEALTPAGPTTLYAQWAPAAPQTVTVSFDANGATLGEMPSVGTAPGTAITLGSCLFSCDGYRFAGWNTSPAGDGVAYADGAQITVASDTVLYAQWVQLVSLSFDANGGVGYMDPMVLDVNGTVTLPTTAFSCEGYNFAGWNTASDGTGTPFIDGASITCPQNVVLYAQWTTSKFITGIQNNLAVETQAGVAPVLPQTASIRWSDNSTSSEPVVWVELNPAFYANPGSFQVAGSVAGHSVMCTVTVTAPAAQNGIVRTGDSTDILPIAIAAGVGVVVVIAALIILIRNRRR